MNKDILKGDWNLVKGKIKEKWGELTDDDITQINGKRDQLLGKLQKKYGITKQNAEEELDQWEKNYSSKNRIDSDLEDDRDIRNTRKNR